MFTGIISDVGQVIAITPNGELSRLRIATAYDVRAIPLGASIANAGACLTVVGVEPHEEPQVPNFGKPKRGSKLVTGLTIAIEPMVNLGRADTRTLSDKWTVVTADGTRSAHFEHTIAVTDNGPRILTAA